jgi:hypothetical protein
MASTLASDRLSALFTPSRISKFIQIPTSLEFGNLILLYEVAAASKVGLVFVDGFAMLLS